MRRLGSVAKPLQPAHCVGVWVFEVLIVGWEKGGGTRGWCDGRSVLRLRMGRLLMGADPSARCILALNRPTPVRSRFSVAQSLLGKSAPGGKLVFGVTESWGVGESAASWFSMLEACWNRSHQEMLSGGRTGGGKAGVGDQGLESPIQVCEGDGSGPARLCSQVCVCGFPCVGQLVQCQIKLGGTPLGWVSGSRWQSSWSRWGCCRVSWRVHCGEAYSAALYTRARAPVLKVEGLAPHDELASRRRRLFLEDTLARSESRCCLYVMLSCLSSFTPRYVGVGLCGSGDPLTFTHGELAAAGPPWCCLSSL